MASEYTVYVSHKDNSDDFHDARDWDVWTKQFWNKEQAFAYASSMVALGHTVDIIFEHITNNIAKEFHESQVHNEGAGGSERGG